MKKMKEIKHQIKQAIRLTQAEDWNAIDGVLLETVANRPMEWIRYNRINRRPVLSAAKIAVKAFAKNADGSFRRCGAFRAEARRNLAEVIFRTANG